MCQEDEDTLVVDGRVPSRYNVAFCSAPHSLLSFSPVVLSSVPLDETQPIKNVVRSNLDALNGKER